MKKYLALAYGVMCYIIFLGTLLYTIGFLGDFMVPKTINTGPNVPVSVAVVINTFLIGLFTLQHSGMARRAFKRQFTKIIPKPIERSTYVLFTCMILALLFWQWRPMPSVIWNVELPWMRWLLNGLFGAGWIVVLVSARLISSGHLFGLKQVKKFARGEELALPEFQTPGLYRYIRHPLMAGFLMVFWGTPTMTAGHLLFALMTTGYVLVGIRFEERDLIRQFGMRYREYRERVPRLIPLVMKSHES